MNERGSLSLTLALLLAVIVTAGGGLALLLHDWRKMAELQIRLDECIGNKALQMKSILEKLERTNQQIVILRATAIAANATPATRAAVQAALSAEVAYQTALQQKWNVERAAWIAKRNECQRSGDFFMPLPQIPVSREPPDSLGPNPLHWKGDTRPEFKFLAFHSPRKAAAKLFKSSQKLFYPGVLDGKNRWQAKWASLP